MKSMPKNGQYESEDKYVHININSNDLALYAFMLMAWRSSTLHSLFFHPYLSCVTEGITGAI